ncbi:MAG: GNAT family N-acetyltransferase [Gammaproteobacteria bacterium]|nr:MAG: GNAT family N-acetyltransferase [Gammaproteobacteria bacterium]
MQLREAKLDDIPELCELLNYLFEQEEEFKPNTEVQGKGLKNIISNSDVGVIVIAIDSDKIIGMVNILYTISTALGSRVAILEDMVVTPKTRGKGVGSMLMKYSLDLAKRNCCKRITLLTDFDNEGAHRFYQDHGFSRSSMVAFRKSI